MWSASIPLERKTCNRRRGKFSSRRTFTKRGGRPEAGAPPRGLRTRAPSAPARRSRRTRSRRSQSSRPPQSLRRLSRRRCVCLRGTAFRTARRDPARYREKLPSCLHYRLNRTRSVATVCRTRSAATCGARLCHLVIRPSGPGSGHLSEKVVPNLQQSRVRPKIWAGRHANRLPMESLQPMD